jgi:phosphomannomutase
MMTLMMTVSGVRGIVGETMTPTLAAELGKSSLAGIRGPAG